MNSTNSALAACACGVPNQANFHIHVVYTRGGKTTYTDGYSCEEHIPAWLADDAVDADADDWSDAAVLNKAAAHGVIDAPDAGDTEILSVKVRRLR